MKKFDPTDLKPCRHMRVLVSAHVDKMLPGVADWYTKNHIKGCKQCQASIPFLDTLKERLQELDDSGSTDTLSQDRLNAVQANLNRIDSGSAE